MRVEGTGRLVRQAILLIIITLLFLTTIQSQPGIPLIQTDKAQYTIGETVYVTVTDANINEQNLYYEYEGFTQRYMGDYTSFSFAPVGIGTHNLVLRDKAGNEITRTNFEIIAAEQPAVPELPAEEQPVEIPEQPAAEQELVQEITKAPISEEIILFGTESYLTGEYVEGTSNGPDFLLECNAGNCQKTYYASVVNYYNGSAYVPINTTIENKSITIAGRDYRLGVDKGIYQAYFRDQSSDVKDRPVAISQNNYTLTFSPQDYITYHPHKGTVQGYVGNKQQSFAVVNGNEVVYPEQYKEIGSSNGFANLSYKYYHGMVKEELIIWNQSYLKDRFDSQCNPEDAEIVNLVFPNIIRAYYSDDNDNQTLGVFYGSDKQKFKDFGLSASDEQATTDEVYFTDQNNATVYYIPELYAYDSNGSSILLNKTISMTDFSNLRIDILVPFNWLNSSERVYPIIIDPSTAVYNFSTEQNIKAWMCDNYNGNIPPASGPYPGCTDALTDATTQSGLDSPEGTTYDYPDVANGREDYLLIDVDIQEDEGSITMLNFSWRGGAEAAGAPQIYFHLWNATSAGWKANCTGNYSGTALAWRNCTVSSNIGDFINSSGNAVFMIQGLRAATPARYIKNDFISVEVTYSSASYPAVFINTSLDNTYTTDTTPSVNFNFTDSDNTTANCSLYFDDVSVANNASTQNITDTVLTPGSAQSEANHSVYVNCTDGANTNKSSIIHIIIDNTAPTVNINVSLNNTIVSVDTPLVGFNFSDSVSNTADCTLYFNGSNKANNASVLNWTHTDLTASSTSDGRYDVWVNCTDESGKIGKSDVINLTIAGPPSVTDASASPRFVINGSVVNISASATSGVGIHSVIARIYYPNGTSAVNYSMSNGGSGDVYWNASYVANFSRVAGMYNVTVFANDTAGGSSTAQTNFTPILNLSQQADIGVDGTFDDWSSIKNVSDLVGDGLKSTTFSSVSAGSYHSCGVHVNGTVYCWGSGQYGALGDGNTGAHEVGLATPLNTSNGLINNFNNVSIRATHSCGVHVNGTVYCWGQGDNGRLGDGNTGAHDVGLATALNVSGGLVNNFSMVSVSDYHSCGVHVNGTVYCWGSGQYGALGDGNTGAHDVGLATALNVSGGLVNNFSSVSAGSYHSCGVHVNGTVYCWGMGYRGRLGDGSITDHNLGLATPLNNTNASNIFVNNFSVISAGSADSCGVHVNGTVYCWGYGNAGALGDGNNVTHDVGLATALNVSGGLVNNFSMVSVSDSHSCGVSVNGTVYCWGQGLYGQLGDGRIDTHDVALATPLNNTNASNLFVNNFSVTGVGYFHTCGVHVNGTVYCWGYGDYGELGDGNTASHNAGLATALNTSASFPFIFDLQKVSLVNNNTYLFAKMIVSDNIDFSDASKYYAVYLSTNDVSTGSQYSVGGASLPFLYDYRIQVNGSACTVYNYTNASLGSCNMSNSSNTIELRANLSLINMTNGSVVNITFETGSSAASYDFAPDYNSFLQYTPASTAGGADNTPPTVSINISLNNTPTADTTPTINYNFTDNRSNNASCILYFNGTGYDYNASVSNNTPSTLTVNTSLSLGRYDVWINCTDGSGNEGKSNVLNISISAAPISISDAQCTPSFVFNGSVVNISATVTAAAGVSTVIAMIYYPDGSSAVNYSMTNTGGGDVYWNASYVSDFTMPGLYNVTIFANDTVGLSSNSTINFTPILNLSKWNHVFIDGSFSDWSDVANASDSVGTTDVIFSMVSAGYYHSCGILTDGRVYCWGQGDYGQLGDGNTADHEVGLATALNTSGGLVNNFSSVSAGYYHSCGILTDGRVYCWGRGDYGQLGDGRNDSHEVGLATALNTSGGLVNNFSSVSAGYYHSCGVHVNGTVYCWGSGSSGALADGNTGTHYVNLPRALNNTNAGNLFVNNFSNVSASFYSGFSCGVHVNGSVYCWGYGNFGNLGDGNNGTHSVGLATPLNTSGGLVNNFSSVSPGSYHSCGVHVNGTVYCWGNGGSGQLGDGLLASQKRGLARALNNTNASNLFVNNFSMVEAGNSYSCGVHVNGTVYCWGSGYHGAVGDGNIASHSVSLARVLNNTNASNVFVNNFSSVSAGTSHSCGVHVNGSVYCWGYGDYGQLGDGRNDTHDIGLATLLNYTAFSSSAASPFDLQAVFLANNATYLFARMIVDGTIDFSTATNYYAVYLSTNDPGTGSQYGIYGEVLPFLHDYRLQINNSVCAIYNYTNQSQGSCSFSNNSDTIELAADMSLINMSVNSIVNLTFEAENSTTSYDFAPDYNSFLQYIVADVGEDSTPPTVNINTSLSGSFTANTQPIIGFNFTDTQSNTANCTLYFSDVAYNFTSGVSKNSQTNLIVNISLSPANYSVWVNCTDESGNTGKSSVIWMVVDNVAPTVNAISPADYNWTTNFNRSNFFFNYSDSQSSTASCILYIGSDNKGSNSSVLNYTQSNITSTAIVDGTYSWNVTCTDLTGNSAGSIPRTITIDTVAPTVNINTSKNNTVFTINNPGINFNYSDSLSPNASCILYFDGISADVNASTLNWTNTVLTSSPQNDDNYSVYINCTDLAGNRSKSGVLNIEVDTTAPAITNVANDGINSSFARVNWTTNEEANGSVKYGKDVDLTTGEEASVGLVTAHSSSLSGLDASTLYYYNITSCDAQGWCNTTGPYSFTTTGIDFTAPTVNINLSLNQSFASNTQPSVDFNFTDDYSNHANCTLYFGGVAYNVTNDVDNNTPTTLIVNISLSPSNYSVWVNCTDNSSNEGKSGVIWMVVDNVAPTVNINISQNNTVVSVDTPIVGFNFSDSLSSTANCTLYFNGTSKANNASALNWTRTNLTASPTDEGRYDVWVNCTDLGGNIDKSDVLNITIDVTPPGVSGALCAPSFVFNGSVVNISATVTDNFAVSTVIARVYYPNGTSIANYSMSNGGGGDVYWNASYVSDFTMPGLYNVTIFANDTGGLSSNSTINFTPILNLSQLGYISIDGSFDDWVNITNVSDIAEDGFISSEFISAVAGYYHSCGVHVNGTVYCWGSGEYGNLGDGNTADHEIGLATALNTSGGLVNDFSSVSSSQHSCGVHVNGSVYCWGYGTSSQLGDGGYSSRGLATPLNTSGGLINNFSMVSAGASHSCGLHVNGTVYCWGSGYYGAVGDGNIASHSVSLARALNNTNASNLFDNNFSMVSAGYSHSCGVHVNGTVYCWGLGSSGQLGIGDFSSRGLATPLNTSGGLINNFSMVSAGYSHSCGVHVNGTVYCWGYGLNGALGDGDTGVHYVTLPRALNNTNASNLFDNNFSMVEAGNSYSCGVHVNGTVYCWGLGSSGQLGIGDFSSRGLATPLNTSGGLINNFSSVRATQSYSCGVHVNGTVYCWGLGDDGQLGDGRNDSHNVGLATPLNNSVFPIIFDFQTVSLANNNTYFFAKIVVNDSIDFSDANRYYAVYLSTNDETTGSQYTAGGGTLPFLFDYRIQVNSSACTIYNYTNQSQGSCSFSNNSNTIELSANLSLINMSAGSIVNLTFETGSSSASYDFAPDYNSFLQYTAVEGGGSPNQAPVIDSVDPVSSQTPLPDDIKYVQINFTATDTDGIANLNHSSAKVNVTQGSISRIGNCSNNTIDSDTVKYNCSVPMNYYDPAGSWAINVSVSDLAGLYANNTENSFNFNELLYISLSSTIFGFGEFFPGDTNQPASSNPLFIDNLGNVNLTIINITAYNLVNGSYLIGASNITVNVSDSPGISLENNSMANIPYANVSVDVDGIDANESLYFYISIPNVPSLNYSSSNDWVITADK